MTTDVTDQATTPAQGDDTVMPTDAEVHSAGAETTDQVELDNTESSETGTNEAKDEAQDQREKDLRRLKRRNEKLLQDRAVERAERERLAAELERIRTAAESDDDTTAKADPRAIAQQMRLAEKTAEATQKVMKEAAAKFPDFESAVADLVEEIGPQIDQHGRPSPLMDAVLDSDNAAAVLHYLGKNTEIAAELAGLTPARIGRRISAIESELKAKAAPPKPSAAAKPLTPIKASAPPPVDPSKLTDKQWAELRRQERMRA